MTTLVRSAALNQFANVAASCNLNARALLSEVGLPARALDDPDLKVPTHLVVRLLHLAAERGHEPAFGLRMAESRRLSNLGPLALLVRDEPTLRDALEALMRHAHLHNEGVAVRVEAYGGLVVIRTELTGTGAALPDQASELVVGATFRVLQVFMGSAWRPRLVCFRHRAPRSLAVHHRVLGPAVEFGHEFNGIVCNAADLDSPNPGADPVLARYSQKLLAPALASSARAADRVRQLIVLMLPRGLCRVEVIAQHLGVDRRTVHRWLEAEGTSFSALVAAERGELATRYVEGTERPLSEVAALLGFTAPSAFSRWHVAEFGVSAAQRRASVEHKARGRSRSASARGRQQASQSR